MNPYQVLGVSPGDSEDTIKRAYRNAAKKCHPDTHPGDRQAEERFKEIGEAYRILGNSQKRKEYDETAARQKQDRAGIRPKENRAKKQQNINPMDVSDLFERYMGFKR